MKAVAVEKQGKDGSGGSKKTGPPAKFRRECMTLETGRKFMPNVSMKKLTKAVEGERDPLAKLRLLACRWRKAGRSIREICKILGMPYSTVRDWLVRMSRRGLKGRFNRRHRGRVSRFPKLFLRTVRKWLKKKPKDYGFESGSWQLNLILEMIRREFVIDCKMRTLRRKLRRIRYSWRKFRNVPHKSASKREREEFKRRAGEKAKERRAEGYAVFVEDEAAAQMSQKPGYGWRPTNGHDEVQTDFSKKSVKLIGMMSENKLYVRIVDATNSETFKQFMEDVRRDHPRFYMVLDNASYHKSHVVNDYVKDTNGDIELEHLPPYTPQLNQIENVWRDLKRRLSGRYFKSIDELKKAIIVILANEMNHRLKGYLVD